MRSLYERRVSERGGEMTVDEWDRARGDVTTTV